MILIYIDINYINKVDSSNSDQYNSYSQMIEKVKEITLFSLISPEVVILIKTHKQTYTNESQKLMKLYNGVDDYLGALLKVTFRPICDIESMITFMHKVDKSQAISLHFNNGVDFSSENTKELFEGLQSRNLQLFEYEDNYISKNNADALIQLFSDEKISLTAISLNIEESSDVLGLLQVLSSKPILNSIKIITDKPIDLETEKFAKHIYETKQTVLIEVNSRIKGIKPMDKRPVNLGYF